LAQTIARHALPLLAGLLLAITGSGCATQPLVQGVDPAGRRIVLLLDSSTSMRENDPGEAALAGTELAMALVGTQDNVAVVPYSRRADVLLPLTKAGDTTRRAQLRRRLAGLTRSGVTNFTAALGKAREVLEAGNSPPGSAIVLLTDGVPYRQSRGQGLGASSRTLDDEVGDIAAKGWRIFAIAMGAEASSAFLSRMVGETGGAVILAKDADALLTAFQEVATEALGYLRAERGSDAVRVVPHTKRLAFLGRWPGQGEIAAPQHNGQAVDPARVIRLPAQGAAPFAVSLIESPEPGVWQAERAGASEAVTLIEPSFGVEFLAGSPPAEVKAGEGFAVRVEVGGDAEVVAQLSQGLRLRAQLLVDGQPSGGWTVLQGGAGGVYGGQLRAPAVTKATPASVVVEAEVGEGASPFVLKRSRALAIRAPRVDEGPAEVPVERPRVSVSVSPAQVRLARWEGDEAPDRVRVTVTGDPERAVTLRGAGEELELEPGASEVLDLEVPAGGGRIRLRAESSEADPAEAVVTVAVDTFRLQGPQRVRLRSLPAGFVNQARLPYAVTPEGALSYRLSTLRGPGGARLKGEVVDGRLRLDPPADTPPGRYRGTLRLRVAGVEGLAHVDREVEVEVLPAWRPPDAITVQGSWGWATEPIQVSLPQPREVPVAVELAALTYQRALPGEAAPRDPPALDPELDLRWKPLDDWSGEALSFEPQRLALSVYLSSDLPTGVYGGEVRLIPQGGEPVTIPVSVEVRR
jgi:Mg-chelatase subunit ChlD